MLVAIVRGAMIQRGPTTVVLTGASGAGKTHVLRELLTGVTAPTRTARGEPGSMHDPYGVACRLLGTDLPDPVPPDSDGRLLSRFDELAASGLQVLAVDDAHRSDAASLGILERVAAAARDMRVCLVLTRQPSPDRAFITRILERDDCVEVELPRLDALDLDALVREHTGHWPGPGLRTVLDGAEPLEALTLLDDLGPRLVRTRDIVDVAAEDRAPPAASAVTRRVASLESHTREVARALAVLGVAATVDDVAVLVAADPVSLVEPFQSLIDADVMVFDGHGRVEFTHDAWRDAVYDDIPDPLRSVLHRGAATRVSPIHVPRQLASAGAPAVEVMDSIGQATHSLGHAPAVEADLLDRVLGSNGPDPDLAAGLAARRARALARSGQFRRAEEIAQAALAGVHDPIVAGELRRVVIFSRTTRADVAGAMAAVDETLLLPIPERVSQVLTDHRSYLGLLGGTGPVPELPISAEPLNATINGLMAEVLRTYLLGQLATSLEYAWEASRRVGTAGVDPNEGLSADVWPPVVELAQHGPDAARTALNEVIQLREKRDAGWQTASHQIVAAAIDFASGRLDDSAVTLDNALETAATTELGWTSQAVGTRALVDVLRGALTEAEKRLDRWDAEDRPLQFGIPQPDRARVALLEAQRRYAQAAELAQLTWQAASVLHLRTWMVMVAPEFCRVAVRAAAPRLLALISDGLAEVPRPWATGSAPYLLLAEAIIAEPTELAGTALVVAGVAHHLGETYLELMAREEAAVATAIHSDRKAARDLATEALALAGACGAEGTAVRIAGRLRAAGVRLGSTAPRSRPTTGWDSLTPTEQLVVDQVAAGRTGPEIAQHLNISPRTVQTHVSHVLTKLGLSHRVELASAAAARSA
jgi:DNA-binding CsgD family transcriptional regulator